MNPGLSVKLPCRDAQTMYEVVLPLKMRVFIVRAF